MMSHPHRLMLTALALVLPVTAIAAAPAAAGPATATVDRLASGTDATGDDATRVVDTYFGPVEIPSDPQSIVALDEYSALGLMSVGGRPAHVIGSYQSVIGRQVLEDAGIDVVDGSTELSFNFEQISAWEPDLIVLTQDVMTDDLYETLSDIAPTVMLPYVAPWRESIVNYGNVLDEPARADALIAALEARLAEVAELTPAPLDSSATAPTLSIVANTMGMLFVLAPEAPIATVLAELGWTQPTAQLEAEANPMFEMAILLSPEQLGDHDADVVVVLGGSYFYDAEAVTSLPTFQTLPAAQDGRVYEADGDMWFGTYPFAIYWALEDIALIASGADQAEIGTFEDTAARWEAFQTLSS